MIVQSRKRTETAIRVTLLLDHMSWTGNGVLRLGRLGDGQHGSRAGEKQG